MSLRNRDVSKSSVSSRKSLDSVSANIRLRPKSFKPIQHHGPVQLPKYSKPKYFTTGHGINDDNQRDLFHEFSRYQFPIITEAEGISRRKCCIEKPDERDILRRLYVKKPSVANLELIQDLAPEYYSLIERRPIKERFRKRNYITTIRNVLLTKILSGFRHDDIYAIDESIKVEQNSIKQIKKELKYYSNAFDAFLLEDHTKSTVIFNNAEAASNLATSKRKEYDELCKKYQSLESEVMRTEEDWRTLKFYEMFLHSVSPAAWRKEHPLRKSDTDKVTIDILKAYKEFYKQYEPKDSLNEVIERFQRLNEDASDPLLYFTDFNAIVQLIQEAEAQNVRLLANVHRSTLPFEHFDDVVADVKHTLDAKIDKFEKEISTLREEITWLESKAKYLEKLSREVVKTQFKSLISDKKLLKCSVALEEIYTELIDPHIINHDLPFILKGLEQWYMEQVLFLDRFPPEFVRKIRTKCLLESQRQAKQASNAAKTLKRYERTRIRLERAVTALPKKVGKKAKPSMRRSEPLQSPKAKSVEPRQLTEQERDFLLYFTDEFTHENFGKFGIDLMGDPKDILQLLIGEEDEEDEEDSSKKD